MSYYRCAKCGHEGDHPLDPLNGWTNKLSPGLVERMSNPWPTVAASVQPSPGLPFKYTTLFVSTVFKTPLVPSSFFFPENAMKVFEERVVPVLEKIDEHFDVIGHLALPTVLNLAVTDLHQPVAVFAFVTVVDTGDIKEKLRAAGLPLGLLSEGSIDTISGKTWLDLT